MITIQWSIYISLFCFISCRGAFWKSHLVPVIISQTVLLLPLFLPISLAFPPVSNIVIPLRLQIYLRLSNMNYEAMNY
jgi:hypothetical protein